MLWLTSTLSTLSRLISNVCRLMNPVLWTTRRLVTSVSLVQRWNQAVTVLYSAKIAAMAAIAAIFALYQTASAWFHRWTTETDVTNLRVVHKTGFIKRRTFEMSLDKVESVDVNQSILGRILNYGDVSIFGVGEGNKTIDTIASPLEFRNHITAR